MRLLGHVQAHVKQKNDVMAAMYCLEIAHRLKVLGTVATAVFIYFIDFFLNCNLTSISKSTMRQSLSSRKQLDFRHRYVFSI